MTHAPSRPSPRHRRGRLLMVMGSLLGLVGAAVVLLDMSPSESPTVELLFSPRQIAPLHHFQELFGGHANTVIVALRSSGSPLSDKRLHAVEAVARRVQGVKATWSALSRPRLALLGNPARGRELRLTIVEDQPAPPLLEALPPAPALPAASDQTIHHKSSGTGQSSTKATQESAALALDRLLRPNPHAALIMIQLAPAVSDLTALRAFCARFSLRLEAARLPGEELIISGTPYIRVASWELAKQDLWRMWPLLTLVIVLVPWLFFRSLASILVPLLLAVLTSAITLSAYRWFVGPLNPLVLPLVPLLWSVATLDAIHLLYRQRLRHSAEQPSSATDVRRELYLPCLFTTLTTAGGLCVLALVGERPLLQTFGLFGCLGTLLAYVLTFVLGQAMIDLLVGLRPMPRWPSWWLRRVIVEAQRRHTLILGITVVLLVLAAFGLTRIHVHSRYPHLFTARVPHASALGELAQLTGTDLAPLEIYVEATTDRSRTPARLVGALIGLQQYLKTLPETRFSLSAALLAEELLQRDNRALAALRPGASFRSLIQQDARRFDTHLRQWLQPEHGAARLQLHLAPTTLARKRELLGWIRHYAATMLPDHRLTFGGPGYLYYLAEEEGRHETIRGFTVYCALLLLLFVLAFRRPWLILVAVIGNTVPLILLGGLIGALHIPWSIGMLPLPVVLLSISVDDTIHLLWPLRRGGLPSASGLCLAARRAGPALLATTLILAGVFASMMVAGFRINQEMGGLLALGLVLALAGDVLLVGALLRYRRLRD